MALRVIIPVKPFGEAKQRLAAMLDSAERAHLAEDMFRHVVDIAKAFFGAPNVFVISRSKDVLAMAETDGALGVLESKPFDLNSALSQAARFSESAGASKLLVLASDLPLLRENDLAELTKHDCAIAPDHRRRGTNALLWPIRLPFAFGEDSFARHLAIAQNADLTPQIVSCPGLARDIDVPEDLLELGR